MADPANSSAAEASCLKAERREAGSERQDAKSAKTAGPTKSAPVDQECRWEEMPDTRPAGRRAGRPGADHATSSAHGRRHSPPATEPERRERRWPKRQAPPQSEAATFLRASAPAGTAGRHLERWRRRTPMAPSWRFAMCPVAFARQEAWSLRSVFQHSDLGGSVESFLGIPTYI